MQCRITFVCIACIAIFSANFALFYAFYGALKTAQEIVTPQRCVAYKENDSAFRQISLVIAIIIATAFSALI